MISLVLASGSPRRRQLLSWLGFDIIVAPQDVDESRPPSTPPIQHAENLARKKALSAFGDHPDHMIIAADTVVHLGDDIFDKPVSRDEAREHLTRLSGQTHQVTTGVAVGNTPANLHVFSVTTHVRFRTLTPSEIDAYLATGEADDKAGAYGIQGRGGAFAAEVHGSWTNVMGLPVEDTLRVISQSMSSDSH